MAQRCHMNYLVTGGAGFIGSHLVTRLVADGTKPRIIDDFSTGKEENLLHLPDDSFEMFEDDIVDPLACGLVCKDIDVIFHQAAMASVPLSVDRPCDTFDANVLGTQNLLEAARNAGVRVFVMASSSSVYGGAVPASEDMRLRPNCPYAAHKAACEHLCAAYSDSFGMRTVCLRYFNVFGPRQDPKSTYAAVIPAFIKALQEGEPVIIHGDGLQSRDFTFVENVVDANLLAADSDMQGAFNVGCGTSWTLLELVSELGRIMNVTIKMTHTPPRAGDVRTSLAVVDSIGSFGYEPAVTFADGLARTVEWFNSH